MRIKLSLLVIGIVFLSACSLGSKATPKNNSNTNLSTEEFGEIVMNFKNKINDTVDSTEKQIDNSDVDKSDSEDAKTFLEDFKKTINEIEAENNEKTIAELFQDEIDKFDKGVDGLIEDDLNSPQNTIEEDAKEQLLADELEGELAKDELNKTQDKNAKELSKMMKEEKRKELIQQIMKDMEAEENRREILREILEAMRKAVLEDYNDMLNEQFTKIAEEKNIKQTKFTCKDACQMYSDCAGYGEGVGAKGMQEAYNSCFQECQKWSTKTLSCIKKIGTIKSAVDCAPLTMCALKEY